MFFYSEKYKIFPSELALLIADKDPDISRHQLSTVH